MEKDLSKLRPFNPEEAKAGGLMCDVSRVSGAYTYIAGPDAGGWIATENEKGIFIFSAVTNLFMLPLCWVEGWPVYPDTPMERADNGWPVSWSSTGNDWQDEAGNWASGIGFDIRWPKPKINRKGWVNIYRPTTGLFAASASDVHETKKKPTKAPDMAASPASRLNGKRSSLNDPRTSPRTLPYDGPPPCRRPSPPR